MATTITPLGTHRNERPYPFCPGCGHGSILDALDRTPGAATLLIAYGITAGAAAAATATARAEGIPVSLAVPKTLWPVPETRLREALDGVERVVVAELNDGLYRREIERIAGVRTVNGVHRIDGELITPAQILEVL